VFANSLNKEVNFSGLVSFWQLYRRNFHLEAVGLSALQTFKVDMIVVVPGLRARMGTKGVFQAAFIVKNFMDQALVEESLKCPVNGYTVEGAADLILDVSMGKRIILV
jgi:hypothetical protein